MEKRREPHVPAPGPVGGGAPQEHFGHLRFGQLQLGLQDPGVFRAGRAGGEGGVGMRRPAPVLCAGGRGGGPAYGIHLPAVSLRPAAANGEQLV